MAGETAGERAKQPLFSVIQRGLPGMPGVPNSSDDASKMADHLGIIMQRFGLNVPSKSSLKEVIRPLHQRRVRRAAPKLMGHRTLRCLAEAANVGRKILQAWSVETGRTGQE